MKRLAILAMAVTLLAGCATAGKLSDGEKLALYRAHAGEPVRDFQYFGSFNGWTDLGDSALAVWTRPNQAWLLELSGPCMDLSYAQAISVTSMMGRVSSGFDKVIVHGSSVGMHVPCRIGSIRPLDVKALRSSENQLREAKAEAREQGEGSRD